MGDGPRPASHHLRMGPAPLLPYTMGGGASGGAERGGDGVTWSARPPLRAVAPRSEDTRMYLPAHFLECGWVGGWRWGSDGVVLGGWGGAEIPQGWWVEKWGASCFSATEEGAWRRRWGAVRR